MGELRIGTFILDVFQRIYELGQTLAVWITQEITIGDWSVSILGLLGGTLVTALIIYSIVSN